MSHRIEIERRPGVVIARCGTDFIVIPARGARVKARIEEERVIARWLLRSGIAIEGDTMTIHEDCAVLDFTLTLSVAFMAGLPVVFDLDREDCGRDAPEPGKALGRVKSHDA